MSNNSRSLSGVSSEGGTPLSFISEVSSEGGTPLVNARPQLNEELIGQRRAQGFVPPPGIFTSKGSRNTLESRQWGDPPFFINAKPASMLERGWLRAMNLLEGERGLLTLKDGPEILVKIVKGLHGAPGTNKKIYTVKDLTDSKGEPFDLEASKRHEEWEFYIPVEAVPFVPRQGGSKKIRNKRIKKSRKMRRKA